MCLVLKLLIFAFLLDSISYSAMCKTAMQIQLKIHCQTGMHRVFFNKRNTSRNIGFGVFKLESSPFKQCDNLKTYTYVILHILCDCICRITRSERFYLFLFFLVLQDFFLDCQSTYLLSKYLYLYICKVKRSRKQSITQMEPLLIFQSIISNHVSFLLQALESNTPNFCSTDDQLCDLKQTIHYL